MCSPFLFRKESKFNDMSSRCFCAIFIFHAVAAAAAAVVVVGFFLGLSLSLDFSHGQRERESSADSRISAAAYTNSHLFASFTSIVKKVAKCDTQ